MSRARSSRAWPCTRRPTWAGSGEAVRHRRRPAPGRARPGRAVAVLGSGSVRPLRAIRTCLGRSAVETSGLAERSARQRLPPLVIAELARCPCLSGSTAASAAQPPPQDRSKTMRSHVCRTRGAPALGDHGLWCLSGNRSKLRASSAPGGARCGVWSGLRWRGAWWRPSWRPAVAGLRRPARRPVARRRRPRRVDPRPARRRRPPARTARPTRPWAGIWRTPGAGTRRLRSSNARSRPATVRATPTAGGPTC